MNSDQLRQFKAIVECGNITKAAEVLFITQPALSMALSKLEDELATPLFIRECRSLKLTKHGEELFKYAQIVTDTIERAEDYFRSQKYSQYVNLYRIGGTAFNLLNEGCFDIEGSRLNCTLVQNKDIAGISASGIADIIIADDRYMSTTTYEYKGELLYHQQLILSVKKEDPMARLDEIDVRELQGQSILGHANPLGFEAWISEIKRDNRCDFMEEIILDNITYFSIRDKIPWPVFIGSFGIGTDMSKDYFAKRKSIRVTGLYTERDIYLWYNKRNKKQLKPIIEQIKANASKVVEMDRSSGYL